MRRITLPRITLQSRKPLGGPIELGQDVVLGRSVQRRVRPGDEVAQDRDQRRVFVRQPVQPGPGGVDEADAVVGEVRGLDHPGPRLVPQAVDDVLPVLLVLVAVRRVRRVRHRADQPGHPRAELRRQHRERGRLPSAAPGQFGPAATGGQVGPAATGGQVSSVIFHGVVQ